ncbi:polysaccharide biosynthesis tyrosine autokinase [Sphingomonas sp. LY54]|uniref:GumC family protein n=1 Tax=Sphingomonas sp. LY54 TaxID=3095343 RepID=UPI002D765035|nr:polysaccharide biosynthesis tyrosine autokinase [Sphingomonas sp. LY54]WRP27578.1 polysaccharide biosynthesis tyrosine autokinase [Sphingomonas sp. LY54]
MSKTDLDPSGAQRVWPLATDKASDLALRPQWGVRSYASPQGIDINLAMILRILSEWRWLILAAVAVGLAGAVLVTFLTAPAYRATATLEINPPSVAIMEDEKAPAMAQDREYLATQYGLLASRTLAQRVAQDLNLAANDQFVPIETEDRSAKIDFATDKLRKNFEVDPVKLSRLIIISYSSEDPVLATKVVNSFADNFINSNLERRYEASSYARNFLERQIRNVKGELEKSERLLVGYAQRQGIINTGTTADIGSSDANSLTGASLVELNKALAAAQTQRIAAEQKYRQASAVGTTAEVNESTAPLRQQRAALESEYQERLTKFRPDYPDMISLRSRIDEINRQIRAEAGNVAGGRSNSLLADYQAAAAAERTLQARVNELKASVLNLRGRTIQYNILQREVDTNRSLYDALLQRYKEIGVAGGIGTNLVSVVDRADVPTAPYKPNLFVNLAIGLILGLAAGLGAAFVLEFLNDTVKTPDDVRDKLGLTSLGVVPRKENSHSLSEELKDLTSPISEAYFSVRTALQFTTEDGVPKSLLVTSTRPAEGKSSTTLALAQNFARLGNSVLLIDADLRKPAFVTGSDTTVGLSRLLTNHDRLRTHVRKTQIENLCIIPCGPLPPNPAELLSSPRLKALIAEASAEFDLVILDGPPVLGLADAPLLGAVTRGTLMVIESGKTRTKAAVDAINRLQSSGSHIIGAVLTKFRHQAHGYGYGYDYEPYRYGGVGKREREIELITQREA